MKLIIAKPSPFARKVRIAIIEKRIDCEIVVDNPWLPETQVNHANPLGKVPVLILDDARVIHDSKVIIDYLETLNLEPALIPADPQLRIAHKQIEAIADGICDAVVLISLECARPQDKQSKDWIERQRNKVIAGVAELSQAHKTGAVLTSNELGLAQVATQCALDYLDLRYPQYEWRKAAPNLIDLYTRLSTRPSFASTKPQPQALPKL